MQLYADKVKPALAKNIAASYLISGDDIYLQNETADHVRTAAKKNAFTEREIIFIDANADWMQWLDSCNTVSLFSEKRLVELRLPSIKIGSTGSDAICRYCEDPNPDICLLVICPALDGATKKSKWVKALDKIGITTPIYPLERSRIPAWLKQKAADVKLSLDNDAAQLLADRVEGNSTAAMQELEKLSLLFPENSTISAQVIANTVADSAKISLFNMLDSAIAGNAKATCNALQHIRNEGTEPAALIGLIHREVNQLQKLYVFKQKRQLAEGFKSLRIFAKKQQAMSRALEHLKASDFTTLAHLGTQADQLSKSIEKESAWLLIEHILLTLAGQPIPTRALHIDN